jgi:hypothetical protein
MCLGSGSASKKKQMNEVNALEKRSYSTHPQYSSNSVSIPSCIRGKKLFGREDWIGEGRWMVQIPSSFIHPHNHPNFFFLILLFDGLIFV